MQFLLALVTSISGIEQGDLSKIDHRKKTQITVIKIDDIIGLVGLVKRKKETYVVYKKNVDLEYEIIRQSERVPDQRREI